MSGKKSLLVDKSKMPLAMGIAFVAFTTQFGGGFASGAQIYQYFINYGIWCLLMPLITQGLYALFFWYGMRYAYKHKTYDYRSFSDSLYGKTRPIMSNLYEICYLIMIGTASAAAFATGGSTLQMLFGIPYWVCTLIIAAFIFVIALFGTSVVRKCASTLSVLILIGLVLVLVPNIIVQWDAITAAISNLVSGKMPVISGESGAFGPALYSAVLYFFFQLASVSVMYQHMEPVTEKREIEKKLVEEWIDRGDIYEEKKHHNVIFVGRDADGIPRYAHCRGTGEIKYRGDVAGSDKSYGFSYRGTDNQLFVFEAAIDWDTRPCLTII